MLSVLHTKIARWINRLDNSPARQIWFNFSARWLERSASAAAVKAIYRFRIDTVKVLDDFRPDINWATHT
jgi:hypothetical protein